MHPDEVERRMEARQLLRRAYLADVRELARALASRICHGEFDSRWHRLEEIVDAAVLRHPRVSEASLSLEAVAYSDTRTSVETDFVPGWSFEPQSPWARFEGPVDPEYGEPCELVLPPGSAIWYNDFARDVEAKLYAAVGDSPFNYLAARLGFERR